MMMNSFTSGFLPAKLRIGTFDTDISGFEDSDVDLDDYNGFIHARFDEDDFTLNEIDD